MSEKELRERTSSGNKKLDSMMDGGPLRGSVTLVIGAPGTGKTCVGLEFIARGITELDEPGLIVTFEHFPKKLLRDANSLGLDLEEMERKGMLRILFTSPEIFFEQAQAPGGLLDTMVQELGAKRILIPSENKRDLAEVPDAILTAIQWQFYDSPTKAAIMAMGMG